jgi:hypothetical protein
MTSVQVTYASEASPGGINEDYVVTGPTWWAVLDGATKRPDVNNGCHHGAAWLTQQLGAELAVQLTADLDKPLPDLLAKAIKALCDAHADSCDLTNPDSPSATVVILRECRGSLDWLVLADSPLLLDFGDEIHAVVDDRTAHLPSYTTEAVRAARNSPGGFWVASTCPEAAYQALTGTASTQDVKRAALLTDGAARLVERYAVTDWRGLLELLDDQGPAELIRQTRAAELKETDQERASRRGKPHDDATAVIVRFSRD